MKIGDTLYCKDGSTVKVFAFNEEMLVVEYKGKKYRRPISAINATLFLQPANHSFFNRIKQMISNNEYNSLGFDRDGYDRDSYDHNGYDRQGYDKNGIDKEGYDKQGFSASGFNRDGFDRDGFNKLGLDEAGFNREGYDCEGYNRRGYNKDGYNNEGFDRFGYNILGRNKYGYDRQGYDEKGYDKNGIDIKGIDKEGYDRQGFSASGFNREGFDRDGFNKFGLDKAGFNRGGYDSEGYNRRGYNKDGYNRNGFDVNGYNKDGYDGNGFNKQGLDRSGRDKNGYDISGYDAEGYSRAGYDHKGYNRKGFDKDGYGRDGFNHKCVNRNGELRPELSRDYKANETILFHEIYGRGTFLRFSFGTSTLYIHVKFDNGKDEIRFHYPDSIGQYLFLQPSQKTLEKERLLESDSGKKEYKKEKSFFDDLIKELAVPYKNAQRECEDAHVTRYDLAEPDEWDESTYRAVRANKTRATKNANFFAQLYSEPYFAKVDYAKKSNMYIGKHGYKDAITDWTDPECSIYYEYQMYIGNKNFNLSLIRDFDICDSKFYGFLDTYNRIRQNEKNTVDASIEYSDTIKDERLLMIINAQRKDKEVHDIIATIQANQYKMITHPKDNAIVVEGCAGSGKTMILLHRLRYLLRNNKNLQATNVYVLSPSDTLNMESGALASTLQLDNVNRFSNQSLFQYVGSTYAKNENLYWPIMTKKGIVSNSTIDSNSIKKLYDKKTIDEAVSEIRKLYQLSWVQKEFINSERAYILAEKASIAGIQGSITSAQLELLSKGRAFYERALIECRGRSPKNAKAAINDVNSDFSRKQKAVKDDENHVTGYVDVEKKVKLTTSQKEFKSSVLLFLVDHPNYMAVQTLYEDKNSKNPSMVNDSSEAFNNTFHLFEMVSTLKTNDINVGDDPFVFYREYSTICDKEQRLDSFSSNSSNYNYLYDVIEYIIRNEKEALAVPLSICYEWEGFWRAYIFSSLFNSPFLNVELMFVDEFQDYSVSELEFLDQTFPACCFNFFGDFKQCISSKGISESDFSKQVNGKKFDRFYISENYRNAMEITEYVNTQFGINMRPVGISGTVNFISFGDISSIEIDKDDRVAFIVSDISQIEDNELLNKANVMNTIDRAIERGILNIMPVAMAKGLEFETVVVKTDYMTENEKYVAMTRALNSLFIVEI